MGDLQADIVCVVQLAVGPFVPDSASALVVFHGQVLALSAVEARSGLAGQGARRGRRRSDARALAHGEEVGCSDHAHLWVALESDMAPEVEVLERGSASRVARLRPVRRSRGQAAGAEHVTLVLRKVRSRAPAEDPVGGAFAGTHELAPGQDSSARQCWVRTAACAVATGASGSAKERWSTDMGREQLGNGCSLSF